MNLNSNQEQDFPAASACESLGRRSGQDAGHRCHFPRRIRKAPILFGAEFPAKNLWLGLALLVAAISLLGAPAATRGAGFALVNQGTAAMAQGNAFVAEADDPSAIYYNPAGLNQIKRPTLYTTGFLLLPRPGIRWGWAVLGDQAPVIRDPVGLFCLPGKPAAIPGGRLFQPFRPEYRMAVELARQIPQHLLVLGNL